MRPSMRPWRVQSWVQRGWVSLQGAMVSLQDADAEGGGGGGGGEGGGGGGCGVRMELEGRGMEGRRE